MVGYRLGEQSDYGSLSEAGAAGETRHAVFAELQPILLRAHSESPEGNDCVIHGKLRDGCGNWRTQFERLIRRSGQEPWGCLFQNSRSSREVELSDVFPWFTVCSWIGHSRQVAAEHYMSVPAEHIARAIAGDSGLTGGEKAARKTAQSMHAEPCKASQEQGGEDGETAFCGAKKEVAAPCDITEPQPIPQGRRTNPTGDPKNADVGNRAHKKRHT